MELIKRNIIKKQKKRKMANNKDTEKLKDFRIKVDNKADIFGKPKEVPVAKDATFVKPPNFYPQAESNSNQTTSGRIMEQVWDGTKYVAKKTLEGMANAVEGF